jgi:hypothetical protein
LEFGDKENTYCGNGFANTHTNSKQKIMDLLLAILISMGINVTPKDLTNKEFMLKNQSAIQHAQAILKERQTESTRITFKAAPQTNIFKQSKN